MQKYVPWLPVVLALVGFVLYLNTLGNEFIFDDEPHIVLAEHAHSLSAAMDHFPKDGRPLVTLSLVFNHAIDGLEERGYHLFNTTIHIIAGLALYALIYLTLTLPRWDGQYQTSAPWWSFAAALLWLAHPLQTQAVTYVIQRAESMMAMFFLLAMVAAVMQWRTKNVLVQSAWTVAAILAALLGAMCKQVIVVLPVVVILYDWVFFRKTYSEWFRERMVLVVGLCAVSGWLVLRQLSGMFAEDASAGFGMPVVTPWGYLISQPAVILHYFKQTFWPHPLVLDYMWLPAVPHDTPKDMVAQLYLTRVLPYAIVMIALFVASIVGVIKRMWWGFCGLSFFIILSPTSSFLPIADLAFEHRMYLPLACVIAVVVFVCGKLLRCFAPSAWPTSGGAVVLLIALALGSLTYARNWDYRTKIAIWDSVIVNLKKMDFKENPRAFHNLGSALNQAGDVDSAMKAYERVIRILPNHAAAMNGIGNIWLDRGQATRALPLLERAAELKPEDAVYQREFGRALLATGQFDTAEKFLKRAVELDPTLTHAYDDLGIISAQRENYDEAEQYFKQAIKADPSFIHAYMNLATTYSKLKRFEYAATTAQRAKQVAVENNETPTMVVSIENQIKRYRALADQAPVSP